MLSHLFNVSQSLRSQCILFVCIAFASCTNHSKEQSNAKSPNFLIILADDMGFSDIGSYGSEIETPHLDELAAHGVRFNQFYNAARCCPTRASMLTGLYPHQVGMGSMVVGIDATRENGPYQGYLRQDSCLTIAEALQAKGYKSYMSGKWHVGEKPEQWPEKRGFDKYWGLISGASSYYEIITDQPRTRVMVKDDQRWSPTQDDFYMTDYTSDYAVQTLKEHQLTLADTPFFSYVAYTAPHWPLHALEEDIQKYIKRYHIGWDSLRSERFDRQIELGLFSKEPALPDRPKTINPWSEVSHKEEWVRKMAVYAAMIDRMDQGIGKIIKQLKEMGEFENTVIMFLSDNGGCAENISGRQLHDPSQEIGTKGSYVAYREPWAFASNTPFSYYKSWTHEGGIATPFILHYPNGNLKENSISEQTAHIIDIMPTILDLAKVEYPANHMLPLQGENIFKLLESNTSISRQLYWEHLKAKSMIDGDWKLVQSRRSDEWELYNLSGDRTEMQNLVLSQEEQRRKMLVDWQKWAITVGVSAE